MIDKLFSVSVAEDDLQRMIKSINHELSQCLPEGDPDSCDHKEMVRPVVHVGITCQNGTHASPSYVEKLYAVYKNSPPMENLTVTRKHRHSPFFPGELREGKEFFWQHTSVPVDFLGGYHGLTNRRMWSPFHIHLSGLIEAGFKSDPFNNRLELPYSPSGGKYVVDFERGEVHFTHERKTYKIRCRTADLNDMVTCNLLEDSSYRSLAKHYSSAGILFYSPHPILGEPVFLLGHMNYGSRCWCDFGGLKRFRCTNYLCLYRTVFLFSADCADGILSKPERQLPASALRRLLVC